MKKQVESYIEFLLGKIRKKTICSITRSILDGGNRRYYWFKNYNQPIFYATKDIDGEIIIIYVHGFNIFNDVSKMFSIPFNEASTIINDYFYQKILYDSRTGIK